jgi:hypothetical protein
MLAEEFAMFYLTFLESSFLYFIHVGGGGLQIETGEEGEVGADEVRFLLWIEVDSLSHCRHAESNKKKSRRH